MDIGLVACVHTPKEAVGGKALTATGDGVEFSAPQAMRESGFPHGDAKFAFDHVHSNPEAAKLYDTHLKGVGAKLLARQNAVIYLAGKRGVPKRELAFGKPGRPETGVLHMVLKDLAAGPEFSNYEFVATAYGLGTGKEIMDLLKLENTNGVSAESLKGPPVISGITEEKVSKWEHLEAYCKTVEENQRKAFEEVLSLPDIKEPFPAYKPENLVCTVKLYLVEERAAILDDDYLDGRVENPEKYGRIERGSVSIVILGDSERPALCGIDQKTLVDFEGQQKTLSAVVGVLGAIRCKRLRVPYGKCRLLHLLKRAYNAEKVNPHNEGNAPTFSLMIVNVFDDGRHAEESFHSLVFAKRIVNVIGGSGVGPASRDLAAERWRLEQDIIELKDELEIVKTVHGYKPCIYNQAKPVQNIKEEEQKRINKILAQMETHKKAELETMRTKAAEEAKAFIDSEQQKSNQNIVELEKTLAEKQAENAKLNQQRDAKTKEYDKQLEKVRKKRHDEEEKTEKLRKDIVEIEGQLQARLESIAKQKEQLELLNKDHTKGKELLMKSRAEARAKRDKVAQGRAEQRKLWLDEIKGMDEKILQQLKDLDAVKQKRAASGQPVPADDQDEIGTEASVKADIASINKFLDQIVNFTDSTTEDVYKKTEKIRTSMSSYFDSERERCEARLLQEQARREQLEKAAAAYRAKLNDQQGKVKKDQMADAVKKEKHLESLLEQVVQYLEHGCRMAKIRGVERKRYMYLSDDRKRIHGCEISETGAPANKRRPTTTAYLHDMTRITLGQYTSNFKSFENGKSEKGTKPADLIHDVDGAFNRTPTGAVTAENLSTYFYRSFSLEFKKGTTWDVVAETDSDFEAWVVVLQRLCVNKDEWKKLIGAKSSAPPPTMQWGEPLDITSRQGYDRLMAEEAELCSENHITPVQYINIKAQIIHKAQLGFVTVYDVRTLSTLDLLRSRVVHDFFIAKKVIPQPNSVDVR